MTRRGLLRHAPYWGLIGLLVVLALRSDGGAAGLCSVFKTFGAAEVLTASDLNNSLTQAAVTNSTLQCVSGYSASVAQMQTTADPFPVGTESLASAAADELARLRFVIQKLTGWTQWYKYTDQGALPTFNWTSNADYEGWSAGVSVAPDGWTLTGAGAAVAKNTTAGQFKVSTASAQVTPGAGALADLFQDIDLLAGFGPVARWQSKTVTLGGWVRATVASQARLVIDDGVGTTASAYHTGTGTFQFLTVTRTLNAAATRVRVEAEVAAAGAAAQFDGLILVQGGTVTDFIPSGSTTFAVKNTDLASAATLTLPLYGSYFHVTGAVSITSISTAPAGTIVVLEFDGALTLTHNATTLILQGGINLLTAAGDMVAFVSEGSGNWREAWRRLGTASGGAIQAAGVLTGSANNSDYSTTSATFVDVDATNLKVTVTVPSGAKFLIVEATFGTLTGGITDGLNRVQILAAGTAVAPAVYANNTTLAYSGVYTVYGVVANPPAGSQTIALQFRGDGVSAFVIKNQTLEGPISNIIRARLKYAVTN